MLIGGPSVGFPAAIFALVIGVGTGCYGLGMCDDPLSERAGNQELQAKIQLFTLARANDDETEKVVAYCRLVGGSRGDQGGVSRLALRIIKNCKYFGFRGAP